MGIAAVITEFYILTEQCSNYKAAYLGEATGLEPATDVA